MYVDVVRTSELTRRATASSSRGSAKKKEQSCFGCGGVGHYKRDCPSRTEEAKPKDPKGQSKGKDKDGKAKGKGKNKHGVHELEGATPALGEAEEALSRVVAHQNVAFAVSALPPVPRRVAWL